MDASSKDTSVKNICEVSLFTPVTIDIFVFRLWLNGSTATEIVEELVKKKLYPEGYEEYVRDVLHRANPVEAIKKNLLHDVKGQVRNYDLLSRYLSDPVQLVSQTTFYLSKEVREQLVEEFYQIDGEIMLEMTGKRFKSCRKKKSLDIIAERLRVPLARCVRQYGNLVVACKAAQPQCSSSMTSSGVMAAPGIQGGPGESEDIVERISIALFISKALAFDYAKSVFMVEHKFDIGRSSLSNLKYKHYDAMSLALIRWCPGAHADPLAAQELVLDRAFLDGLKSLKPLLGKEALESYRDHVLKEIDAGNLAAKREKISKEFIPFIKSVMSLISSLEQREFQAIYSTLLEKVKEPCKKMDLSKKEAMVFFRLIIAAFHPLVLKDCAGETKSVHAKTWSRFLSSVAECLMVLYAL